MTVFPAGSTAMSPNGKIPGLVQAPDAKTSVKSCQISRPRKSWGTTDQELWMKEGQLLSYYYEDPKAELLILQQLFHYSE